MSDTSVVRAAQLMSSPVVAVTADHSLAAAREAMREQHVHHLVVLDDYGLAAVLDDRTLAAHWPSGGVEAPYLRKVGDIVRHGVQCVLPDVPVTDVACIMADGHTDAVPVVNRNGVLLGLVTATDLVAAVARGAVAVAARPQPAVAEAREHEGRG